MSNNLVVIAFDEIGTAKEVLSEIHALEAQGDIILEDAVIVERRQGIADINQAKSPVWKSTGRGAAIGFVAGLLVGGPIVGGLLGTAVGNITGQLRDHGIDDHFIDQLSESLAPDSSALFLQVKEANAEKALAVLQQYQGHILKTTLTAEQEETLRKTLR